MNNIQNLQDKLNHLNNSIQKVDVLLELSRLLIYQDYSLGKDYLNTAFQLSKEINYEKGIAWATMKYGSYALAEKKVEESIIKFKESLYILENIKDHKGLSRAYYSLGTAYGYMHNFELSIKYLLKAKKLAPKYDKTYYPYILNNIAETYSQMELYNQAHSYLKLLLKYLKSENLLSNNKFYAIANASLAQLHLKTKQYKTAIYYAEKTLDLINDDSLIFYKGTTNLTLANIYYSTNSLYESEIFAKRAISILTEYGDNQHMPALLILLSKINLKKKNYNQSKKYAREALKKAKELKMKLSQANALEQLSKVYEAMGYYQKSLMTFKKSNNLKNIVLNENLKKKMSVYSINREVSKEYLISTLDKISDEKISKEEKQAQLLTLENISKEIQQAYEALATKERIIELGKLTNSFVESLVNTIDIRDTTTAGHSKRIAGYSVALVKLINKNQTLYKNIFFSDDEITELYYAALLHDIGKLGIREDILLKSSRLNKCQLKVLEYKFKYINACLSLKSYHTPLSVDEKELLMNLEKYLKFIISIVEKNRLTDNDVKKIKKISSIGVSVAPDTTIKLLTSEEVQSLSVKTGNLTNHEYTIMKSHANKTYEYLKTIPWLKTLEDVPFLASSHHEKMDGSGYPKGLIGNEIDLRIRILSIIDIFEALTAKNRPYKDPISIEDALKIVKSEADKHKLDKKLVEFFIDSDIPYLYEDELSGK